MATFTNDELILALVGLVRAVNPVMLQQGADGFTVDLGALEKKSALTADEQLLLKLRACFDKPDAAGNYQAELTPAECGRLATSLETLEKLQDWPEDVLGLSRSVRARLAGGQQKT